MQTKRMIRAMEFAALKHKDQIRKFSAEPVPYFSHVAGVAMLLAIAGYGEDVILAGILHDVTEDCGVSLKELSDQFGPRVAELVDRVSETDKSLPWDDRKRMYTERLKDSDADAIAVAAADHIYNLRNMRLSLEGGADASGIEPPLERRVQQEEAVFDAIAPRLPNELRAEYEDALKEMKEWVKSYGTV